MRDLTGLDIYRIKTADILERFGCYGDETCGAFIVSYPATGAVLRVLASSDAGWDHVSVSLTQGNRTPNWAEMSFIKRTFFQPNETAWEYHVANADHINIHSYTLHIWRKHGFEMPMPPKEFV